MRISRLIVKIGIIVIFCLSGCATHFHAQSAELTALHSGSLKVPDNPQAPKLVYIDIYDRNNLAPNLASNISQSLHSSKFKIVDAPSKAGYILHVSILRQGHVSQDSLKKAVDSGYGVPFKFSGNGERAILADAILTQRRVPVHKRASHQKIKNISSRNALDSAQMRIAISHHGESKKNEARDFSSALAQEIARGF